MLIEPESGLSKPATQRNRVVLPDPEGPSITVKVPLFTLRETPLTAWVLPYFLDTLLISRLAIVRHQALRGVVRAFEESVVRPPDFLEAPWLFLPKTKSLFAAVVSVFIYALSASTIQA